MAEAARQGLKSADAVIGEARRLRSYVDRTASTTEKRSASVLGKTETLQVDEEGSSTENVAECGRKVGVEDEPALMSDAARSDTKLEGEVGASSFKHLRKGGKRMRKAAREKKDQTYSKMVRSSQLGEQPGDLEEGADAWAVPNPFDHGCRKFLLARDSSEPLIESAPSCVFLSTQGDDVRLGFRREVVESIRGGHAK